MADPLYYSTRTHDRSGGGGGGTFVDEGGLNRKKVCSSETSCFKGKNFQNIDIENFVRAKFCIFPFLISDTSMTFFGPVCFHLLVCLSVYCLSVCLSGCLSVCLPDLILLNSQISRIYSECPFLTMEILIMP
jgi:hypothetical protein